MEAFSRLPSLSVIINEVGEVNRCFGSASQNQVTKMMAPPHLIFAFRVRLVKYDLI